MIKINALHFLLLVECVVVLAAAVIVLALRGKKRNDLYRAGLADLERMKAAQGYTQEEPGQTLSEVPPQAEEASGTGAAVSEELANCKYELMVLEGQVKEKDKLLSNLKVKFDAMEKEYLILYDKQQQSDSSKP
jgi:hypothetical protein